MEWRHQARAWGRYLDCLGLLIETGNQLGVPLQDYKDYDRQPDSKRLIRLVREQMDEIPVEEDRRASVMLIHFGKWQRPYHFAFDDGAGRMLHGHAPSKKVVYHAIDEYWREKISYRFDIPGIQD